MMKETISEIMAKEPKYRQNQLYKALFDPAIAGYEEISTFPLELRQKLKGLPWLAVKPKIIRKSKADNTEKALLELADGEYIETVFMARQKEEKTRRTICISSQVGCGMGCIFCATGKQGFRRNLTTEEIIDQFRFWQNRLAKKDNETIGNIVIMGQGEPLLNYENVKKALNIILENTGVARSKITLSTVGEKTMMEKILRDKEFPAVRIAISLHSAIEETRKRIVPSTPAGFTPLEVGRGRIPSKASPLTERERPRLLTGFIKFLIKWSEEYHKIFGSRSHSLSLEYVMLEGINDDEKHLEALIGLTRKLGRVKINLIPLNKTFGGIAGSPPETIKHWHDTIMKAGFACTIRHSQGADIAAACGQLNAEFRM